MSRTERKIAFVAAITLLLSTLEYLIPKPLPFLKLGLANLPLLIILDSFSLKAFSIALLLKAIGQGMVSGTLFSYLFLISLAGTLSSGLVMKTLKTVLKTKVSLVGCSIAGAFASNIAQLEVASLVAYGPSIWVAAPLMLTLGLVSSLVLGLSAEIYLQKGSLPKALMEESLELSVPVTEEARHYLVVTLASLVCMIAIILTEGLPFLASITALMYALQLISGRKLRLLPPLMLLLSLLLLSLFEPNGKVLLSLGAVAFTEGSLTLALQKALRLMSLLAASQCLVASNPKLKGKAGAILVLTLAYFGILSTSFRSTSGSLIERVDQTLLRAIGVQQAVSVPAKPKRTINTALFLAGASVVLIVALSSKFFF